MPVVDEELLLVAVCDVVRALPGFYGCEIAEVPTPAEGETAPGTPYSILYPIAWDYSGPPNSPEADAPVAFQLTTVGLTGQQAIFNAVRARRALVEMDERGEYVTPIDVPGLVIIGRACTTAGGLEPDPRVKSAIDRFVFYVSAA